MQYDAGVFVFANLGERTSLSKPQRARKIHPTRFTVTRPSAFFSPKYPHGACMLI